MGTTMGASATPHNTVTTTHSHFHNTEHTSSMVVPDSVKDKVGPMPDVSAMNKDDLAALCMQLYDQSCNVFGEKFHMEYQVKKRDAEIHNLEMECSESHGTFKVPKLKKVNKFKAMESEDK